MRKSVKRAFALFLCLVMCLSLFPASAFAEEGIAEAQAMEDVVPDIPEDKHSVSEADSSPYPGEPADNSIILSGSEGSQGTDPAGADAIGEPEDVPTGEDAIIDLQPLTDVELDGLDNSPIAEVQSETASGTCGAQGDNLTWSFDEETGSLTISGEGDMRDCYPEAAPWELWKDNIRKAVIADGVTSIGSHAFNQCSQLSEVSLPDTLLSIGNLAFDRCPNLTNIVLPGSLLSIGEAALAGCTGLVSIEIPASVTSIAADAFNSSSTIASITVAPENSAFSSFDGVLFNKEQTKLLRFPEGKSAAYTIPESVTEIGDYAFYCCSGLSAVTIPANVTEIGELAFAACNALTDIAVPARVNRIGRSSFTDCSALTSIDIPEGVTELPEGVCYGCSNLANVSLPKSLTSIGFNAFGQCSSLTSITLPASVTSIGEYAFNNCSALTDVNYGGTVVQGNTLIDNGWSLNGNEALFNATWHYTGSDEPSIYASGECGAEGDNLTWTLDENGELVISGTGEMANYVYADPSINAPWDSLRHQILRVVVEPGVTSIGEDAFECYRSLTSVSLPEGLKTIGYRAFSRCDDLTSITVPASVTSIEDMAFMGCHLTKFTILGSGEISIGTNVFPQNNLKTAGPIGGGYDYEFGWTENIPDNAFDGCDLTSVTIPESVTSIGARAFFSTSLTGIKLPENLVSIGDQAFRFCSQLTSITIPASVTYIGDDAVPTYGALTEILVDEENTAYSSLDGCLYNKEQTELIRFPVGRTGAFEVPESVTSIGKGAFGWCEGLTSIKLPENLVSIGDQAFSLCRNLTSITIPASVTSIGDGAFDDCTVLADVNYGGTAAQKDALIGNGWSTDHNEALYCAVWRYGAGSTYSDIHNFADLKAAVAAYDGNDMYVYYNGNDPFVMEESITLPERLYFCADAEGSSVVIPAGVTLTVEATTPNAFYVENLNVEGSMNAHRGAVYCRNLSGEVNWLRETIASGTCGAQGDNLTWVLYNDGELVISGNGDMADYDYFSGNTAPWYEPAAAGVYWSENANHISSLIVEEGVSSLGTFAFSRCAALTEVSLPHTLREIRQSTFATCRSLSSIELPEGLLSIESDSFGQTSLSEITFPATLQKCIGTWGDGAFESTPLMNIYVSPENPYFCSVDGVVFSKDQTVLVLFPTGRSGVYTVPDGVGRIGKKAFDGSQITTVIMPETVETIGEFAFVFAQIHSITLPNSLRAIEPFAFSSSYGLMSIRIPAGVTSIGDGAFSSCSALAEILVDEANSVYSSIDGDLYNKEKTELLCVPAAKTGAFTIPEGVEKIRSNAFMWNDGLTEITLPSTLREICAGAFSNCSGLSRITIPEGVTSIGYDAFEYCSGLTAVTLPVSVTSIDRAAFVRCDALTDVYYAGTEAQKNALIGNGWSTEDNEALYCAVWRYGAGSTYSDIHNFADLKAAVAAYDGNDMYVYYNGNDPFVMEESITLPEKLYFCADAEGSSVVIPAGVTLTVEATTPNAFYVENLNVEGSMNAHRGAVYYRNLSGEVNWLRQIIDSGECGAQGSNLTWVLYDDGELVISGSGDMADYDQGSPDSTPWGHTSAIKAVIVEDGVTSIGNKAFTECYGLKTVELPNSLTYIGRLAFTESAALETINLPDSITVIDDWAFSASAGLNGNVRLPQQLTRIGEYAFNLCEMNTLTLSDRVREIGAHAFEECRNLTDVYFSGTEELKNERMGSTWSSDSNRWLYDATWHYESSGPQIVTAHFASLTLDGTIGINYLVSMTDSVLANENARAVFVYKEKEYQRVIQGMVPDVRNYYTFTFYIPAAEFANTVSLKFMDGEDVIPFEYDGKRLTNDTMKYSGQRYSKALAADNPARTLIDMLHNYCYNAYLGLEKKEPDVLPSTIATNPDISTVVAADMKPYKNSLTGSVTGLTINAISLNLESTTEINLRFTPDEGRSIEEFRFEVNGKAAALQPVGGGSYMLTIENIAAKDLDTMYTVKVSSGSEEMEIQTSALAYCYTVLKKGLLSTDMQNTCKALYLYNQAANDYFHG